MIQSSASASPRRRRRSPAQIALCCLLTLGVCATPARAQDRRDAARAAALFREARGLSDQGRHEAACEKYAESQKLDPSMGTEFYLAECLERIGDNAGAYVHYASVVKLARAARMRDREAYAGEHMDQVAARVAFLELQMSPETRALPGLAIEVNEREIPIESAARVPVNLGEVRVEVRAEGQKPFRQTILARAGAEILTLEVQGLAGGARTPPGGDDVAPPGGGDDAGDAPPGTPAANGDNTARTVMITMGGVSIGLGAISLGIGIGFGADAFAQWDAYETCASVPGKACDNQFDAADTAATASNLGFGFGIPLALAGIGLILFAPSEDTGEAPATSVGVRLVGSGLVVEGTF